MNTTDTLILTLTKKSEKSAWIVTLEAPSSLIIETTIGPGGHVPAGPLLIELIAEMDERVLQYPFCYDMRQTREKANRNLLVRFLNNKPAYADVSLQTRKYIQQNFTPSTIIVQEEMVLFNTGTRFFTQALQENARIKNGG